MYKRFWVVVFLSAIGFLSSCEKDYFVPVTVDPALPISYATDMQPFFDKECTKCHNGGSAPLNLKMPDSYNNLFSGNYIDTSSPEDSELYIEINIGGGMESHANSAQRIMTLNWITQGALDN